MDNISCFEKQSVLLQWCSCVMMTNLEYSRCIIPLVSHYQSSSSISHWEREAGRMMHPGSVSNEKQRMFLNFLCVLKYNVSISKTQNLII